MLRETVGHTWNLAEVIEEVHAPIHKGPGAQLGRLHLEILRSDSLLRDACYVDPRASDREETELGRDFHRVHDADTVHWWFSRNAQHAPRILEATLLAQSAAVEVKRASARLRLGRVRSYPELVGKLVEFCQTQAHQIADLESYIALLRTLNDFAPSMLFSTRVWSQSGRIDRRPEPLRDFSSTGPDEVQFWIAAEVPLGLWSRRAPLAEEFVREDYPIAIYESALRGRVEDGEATEYTEELIEKVGRSFREYFSDLRMALANVAMEGKATIGRDILAGDEAFWRGVIGQLQGSERPETEIWDVKQTLAFWAFSGTERARSERKFCRTLSAFANKSGGVIIVGVAERQAVGGFEVVGLDNLDAKIEVTRHALEAGTTLRTDQAKIVPVLCDVSASDERFCLAIVVPRTTLPIKARADNNQWVFPLRIDSRTRYATEQEVAALKVGMGPDDYSFVDTLHRSFRGEENRELLD